MRLHYLPLFPILFIPTLAYSADVNEYDIEIVIFEDLSSRYVDSEQWPRLEHELLSEQLETATDIKADGSKAVETADPTGNDVVNITSSDTGMLDKYTKTINASARYNVLVHKAWRQAGLDAESAIDIHIDSEEDQVTNVPATLTGFNSGSGNENGSSISGEIRIILGRYLHIYTDLIYKRPNPSYSPALASSQNGEFKEFSIKSHRRMRSKELHYIDHPLVGVLVKALPVEKLEEETPEQAAQ